MLFIKETAQQAQVLSLLSEWRKRSEWTFYAITCLPSLIIAPTVSSGLTSLKVVACLIACFCMQLAVFRLISQRNKPFLAKLTSDDLVLLDSIALSNDKETEKLKPMARDLLKVHQKVYPNAQNELLRASKLSSDETLLRPTTAHNEMQKEELLRASGEDK